ncbi:hypothetical protein [Thiocystis violacea]|uniref:hypothetical protein n=1 Tax=Thiocystis violacea TaxID=13725 RepID=UPI001908D54C|nr:hypothetical protein [Thiocystis violacea]MBK1720218.1 hypothetical protein [Thiocystis violacea]
MISGVSQVGLTGIQRGIEGLRGNANEIASARQMDGSAARDVSKPLVEQTENLRQVEASAKVLKSSDETIGRLIDIMA